MTTDHFFPTACRTCSMHGRDNLHYYESSQTWILLDYDARLVHIHYGISVKYEEKNTQEAKWVYDTVIQFFESHPHTTFFSMVDFSESDDSEFISLEALHLYEKMMRHPQNGFVVFCGVHSGAVSSILTGLLLVSGQRKRTKVLASCELGEAEYTKWYKTQQS